MEREVKVKKRAKKGRLWIINIFLLGLILFFAKDVIGNFVSTFTNTGKPIYGIRENSQIIEQAKLDEIVNNNKNENIEVLKIYQKNSEIKIEIKVNQNYNQNQAEELVQKINKELLAINPKLVEYEFNFIVTKEEKTERFPFFAVKPKNDTNITFTFNKV